MGDYGTLKSLHGVIHDVNRQSPIIRDKEGFFLGLAYDIRKAYEGQRIVEDAPAAMKEIGPRFGVKILWPVLLVQVRMLRVSLAYIESSARVQSHAYALESVVEEAVAADFANGPCNAVLTHWRQVDAASPDVENRIMSRAGAFCSWTTAQRRDRLPGLLASLSLMYGRTNSGDGTVIAA